LMWIQYWFMAPAHTVSPPSTVLTCNLTANHSDRSMDAMMRNSPQQALNGNFSASLGLTSSRSGACTSTAVGPRERAKYTVHTQSHRLRFPSAGVDSPSKMCHQVTVAASMPTRSQQRCQEAQQWSVCVTTALARKLRSDLHVCYSQTGPNPDVPEVGSTGDEGPTQFSPVFNELLDARTHRMSRCCHTNSHPGPPGRGPGPVNTSQWTAEQREHKPQQQLKSTPTTRYR